MKRCYRASLAAVRGRAPSIASCAACGPKRISPTAACRAESRWQRRGGGPRRDHRAPAQGDRSTKPPILRERCTRSCPEERQKLARLREVRSRRADLASSGSGIYSAEEIRSCWPSFRAKKSSRKRRCCAMPAVCAHGSRAIARTVLADVQARLPSGAVLIEIVVYHQYAFAAKAARGLKPPGSGPVRYGAVVVTERGKPGLSIRAGACRRCRGGRAAVDADPDRCGSGSRQPASFLSSC